MGPEGPQQQDCPEGTAPNTPELHRQNPAPQQQLQKRNPRTSDYSGIYHLITVDRWPSRTIPDNTIYELDNLDVLRGMNSETADLLPRPTKSKNSRGPMKSPPSQDPSHNPILNSPYREPLWHWTLDQNGIAQAPALPGRRESRGASPVPGTKGRPTQTSFDDQTSALTLVNDLRGTVTQWRRQNYPGVTADTKQLLDHWNSDQTEPRLFFAQVEAIEDPHLPLRGCSEVQQQALEDAPGNQRDLQPGDEATGGTKMATGTGKTAVMALVIIWQSVNHHQSPRDNRFTRPVRRHHTRDNRPGPEPERPNPQPEAQHLRELADSSPTGATSGTRSRTPGLP